jgi:hypothetical protein
MFSRAEDPLHHTVAIKDEELFWKKILIVDDEADVTDLPSRDRRDQ